MHRLLWHSQAEGSNLEEGICSAAGVAVVRHVPESFSICLAQISARAEFKHPLLQPGWLSLSPACCKLYTSLCVSKRESVSARPQAWLAVHGPLLRQSATKSSLWSRVVSAAASNVSSRGLQEGTPAELISHQAAQSYRSAAQHVGTPNNPPTPMPQPAHNKHTCQEAKSSLHRVFYCTGCFKDEVGLTCKDDTKSRLHMVVFVIRLKIP